MATTIEIAGIPIERVKGSLTIQHTLEQRSTAYFAVVDMAGTASYFRGQAVEIANGADILFRGFIDYPSRKRVSAISNSLFWIIRCIDNRYLADKRIAAESYTGKTAGFIADALFTKYLQPEGVAIGSIEAGPTIAEMIINYRSVSDALDALAAKSNKIWYIDKDGDLYFVDRTTVVAPFAITASDIIRESEILSELKEASPFYRNRQYVRAGQNITLLQTENRTGDGETVAFPMGYPLASEPTITVAGNPQTRGIKGIDDTMDCYWTKGDAIITFDPASIPGVGAAIVFQYYGLYDIMVLADNLPGQVERQAVEGGTGIIEAIDDEPAINDTDDALANALAKLEYYGVIGKQFSFPIRTYGLEPGQMITITHSAYGLNADEMLVESIRISEFAPNELRYNITAVQGPEIGNWTGFFKALADIKSDIMDRLVIGEDRILIILAFSTGIVEVDETVTETVYACPICGNATLCNGLVVC